ncbi:baseplate-tail tube initiator [Aeromonas phage Assk]|nr:baseplate-tail tube initiator [Aeromonas phage Assk]
MNLIPPIPTIDTLQNAFDRTLESGLNSLTNLSIDASDEIPDLTRFMRKVENTDLARPNMFIVRFGDFRTSIFSDGVFDRDLPIFPDSSSGMDVNDSLFSGTSYAWHRVQDIALGQAHKILTPSMKKIFGAWDPSLIRIIPGAGEILDGFLGTDYDVNRDLALMVKSVGLPSSTLETTINRTDKLPRHEVRGRNYGTMSMTFYCSPSYEERSLMLTWQNTIVNPRNGQFGFYNTYAKDIDVITLDRHGVKQSTVHNTGCFPIEVGEVQLDFENNSQVATFTVTFAVSTTVHVPTKGEENTIDSIESIIRRTTGVVKAIR